MAASLSPHLAEDVVLKSPVLADPIQGKAAAIRVLKVLLATAGTFHVRETIALNRRTIRFLKIIAGDARIEGVDDVRMDPHGSDPEHDDHSWCPLPSVVLMQQKIAAAWGVIR